MQSFVKFYVWQETRNLWHTWHSQVGFAGRSIVAFQFVLFPQMRSIQTHERRKILNFPQITVCQNAPLPPKCPLCLHSNCSCLLHLTLFLNPHWLYSIAPNTISNSTIAIITFPVHLHFFFIVSLFSCTVAPLIFINRLFFSDRRMFDGEFHFWGSWQFRSKTSN